MHNTNEIIAYIGKLCSKNDDTKVFSFGIGNGCNEDLVKKCSEAGRGDYNIIADNSPTELKSKVVASLRKASDPAL